MLKYYFAIENAIKSNFVPVGHLEILAANQTDFMS